MSKYIAIMRPKTLIVSFIPIFLALSIGLQEELIPNQTFFYYSLAIAFCIQIATNIFNDLIDFKKGTDKHRNDRSSSQLSLLERKNLNIFTFILLFVAFFIGTFFFKLHPIYLPLGLASIYFSYGYTGGPFPLAYNYLGEVFAFIFFGPVITLGSFFAIFQLISLKSLYLSLICGLFSALIIAMNNFRDIETDRQVNKNTLAVFFGEKKYRFFIISITVFIIYFSYSLLNNYSLGLLALFFSFFILKTKSKNKKLTFKLGLVSYLLFFILTLVQFW